MVSHRPFPLHPVGTVSHRPFLGLPGEAGMARETRALSGGSGPDGPVVEIRAKRPARSGRDGVPPSIPLHPVGTVSHRPFPGLPGEVGMARETRALPWGCGPDGPVVEIRPSGPLVPVGTVSHRPSPRVARLGRPGPLGTRSSPGVGQPEGTSTLFPSQTLHVLD